MRPRSIDADVPVDFAAAPVQGEHHGTRGVDVGRDVEMIATFFAVVFEHLVLQECAGSFGRFRAATGDRGRPNNACDEEKKTVNAHGHRLSST